MRAFRTPALLPWMFPSLVWRAQPEQRNIYLTFDDGPVEGPTEFVLDTLKEHSIHASFFCIGENVKKFPEVFKRIRNEGHTVGNHTQNHLSGWSVSSGTYINNVHDCDQEMISLTPGIVSGTKMFRPPYGRITPRQIQKLRDYRIVMWDVLTYDFDQRLSPQQAWEGTKAAVRPGSIVVFHDSFKAEKNLRYVLPKFIEHFSTHDYHFKAID